MHLCDFGAKLDQCQGPDGPFDPGCVGPGGSGVKESSDPADIKKIKKKFEGVL